MRTFWKWKYTMVGRDDSGNKIRQMDQEYRNSWGETLQKMTKGAWGTQQKGTSGCDIQKSIINIGGQTQIYKGVVLVHQ